MNNNLPTMLEKTFYEIENARAAERTRSGHPDPSLSAASKDERMKEQETIMRLTIISLFTAQEKIGANILRGLWEYYRRSYHVRFGDCETLMEWGKKNLDGVVDWRSYGSRMAHIVERVFRIVHIWDSEDRAVHDGHGERVTVNYLCSEENGLVTKLRFISPRFAIADEQNDESTMRAMIVDVVTMTRDDLIAKYSDDEEVVDDSKDTGDGEDNDPAETEKKIYDKVTMSVYVRDDGMIDVAISGITRLQYEEILAQIQNLVKEDVINDKNWATS